MSAGGSVAPKPLRTRRPHKKRRVATSDTALRRLLGAGDDALGIGAVMRARAFDTVDALTPPGSLLDAAVRAIRTETDCPPELAVVSTFAVLSAALCATGSTYSYHSESQPTHPALWLVALAESGAGKTWVRDVIAESLGVKLPSIPTPGSGQAYIESMSAAVENSVGYWDADEYGQKIKQIAKDAMMAKLKDALLQSYDHRKLSDNTIKRGLVEVEHPVLVIYGATPDDSLAKCMDAEMLVDGFAARHLWFATEHRKLEVFRYPRDRVLARIGEHPALQQLRASLAEKRHYVISESAFNVLNESFSETVSELGDSLRRGFVRRITHAAGHYAVMYHLLTHREPGTGVGANAARWAWRMVRYHLYSTRRAVALVDPRLAEKISRMAAWIDAAKQRGVVGPQMLREFQQRFSRDVSGADEARRMLALCGQVA